MADGRGQAEIRTSHDAVEPDIVSLEPEQVKIIKKDRVGLDG